nr:MAG: hypothetical protein [Bacteriophage sp.]
MTELKGCKLFMDGEPVPGVKEMDNAIKAQEENFIYPAKDFRRIGDKHYCKYCGSEQFGNSGSYHHVSGCKLLIKEFEILNDGIPEPVFTPPAVELCPVINMEHDYRVYRHNGILTKIECRYCSHKLDIGNSEFIQIPGSAWYIQKNDTGRIERIPEVSESDDGPTITARDLIICSVLLVVAIITIAAHWIFGG